MYTQASQTSARISRQGHVQLRLLATYPNIVVEAVDKDGVGTADTSVDTVDINGLVAVDPEQIAKSDVEILGEYFTCSALLQLEDERS